jgi:5-methylcytosine-specific restriction endonuclease McrA
MKTNYIKKESYPVQRVLDVVGIFDPENRRRIYDFDGDLIKMDSQRYFLFKRDGCKCVTCGVEGTFFRKERDANFNHKQGNKTIEPRFHFNLYAITESGEEVMITKDHIIPKSKGGPDIMSNYQVMCYTCNQDKKNKI